ncbi:MAG: hypothetical protein BAJALOKI2v1_10052 [Promethearchaeota archaeon]|nr:MAG: hypothetical protein BAJALOKI2v1_10052 [Candidatus Lokiarchaeota archaeon]
MAPASNSTNNDEEPPKSVRITTTLDYIDAKIIENLQGALGNSQSSVINYIIKDWIKTNSDKIRLTYGIDIAGIRREIQAVIKGIEIEEEIQMNVMNELQKRFKRIKKMKISSLAEMMSVHEQTLVNIITLKGDDLEQKGLDLEIDGEFIVKK